MVGRRGERGRMGGGMVKSSVEQEEERGRGEIGQ